MWAKNKIVCGVRMVVRIYTATWKCPESRKAKQFFEKKGIEYKEFDISNEKGALEELVNKTNIFLSLKSLPVIEIGENIIYGFNLKRIKAALKGNGLCI